MSAIHPKPKTENKFHFKVDSGIFYKKYTGEITLEDMFASWDTIIENGLIPKDIDKLLLDYRDAKMMFTADEANDIVSFYKKFEAKFKNSRIALVMQSPKQVALHYLTKNIKPDLPMKAFYTIEAALSWLKK